MEGIMIRKVLWLYSPMIIPQRIQTLRHLECHCRQLLPRSYGVGLGNHTTNSWSHPAVVTTPPAPSLGCIRNSRSRETASLLLHLHEFLKFLLVAIQLSIIGFELEAK